MSKTGRLRDHGFTMIEMIIVIAITGILAGIVAVFIARPAQTYADTARRALLADAADVSIRRLSREVRLALPNSLRVTTALSGGQTWSFVEFIPTATGGRYRDVGDGSTSGNFLDFSNPVATTFDVLGPMVAPVAAGDFVVIYNLGEGNAPADAYQGGNRATISAVAGNTISLAANAFAVETPPLPSPSSRFQVVPGGVQAVTYACPRDVPGTMTRYWNYGFTPGQTTPPASATLQSAVAARNVTCAFDYQATVQRTGLFSIQLGVVDTPNNERITLFQQVQVDNTP